ncbi:MAG: glycosyltransferase [Methanobacteriales archaeon]
MDNSENNDSSKYLRENYHTWIENGKLKVIKNPKNFGFAKANNQGIKEAFKDPKCKYLICLNNDTTTEPDFIENFVKMAEKHQRAGSIQAR